MWAWLAKGLIMAQLAVLLAAKGGLMPSALAFVFGY